MSYSTSTAAAAVAKNRRAENYRRKAYDICQGPSDHGKRARGDLSSGRAATGVSHVSGDPQYSRDASRVLGPGGGVLCSRG